MPGPGDSELIKRLSFLLRMQPEEIRALENDLLEQSIAAWRQAIEEKARQYAGRSIAANGPRGNDLRTLRLKARKDAQSIAATWARDTERQLIKLFNKNKRGNRNYYARNIEQWIAEREKWHAPLVANNVVQWSRDHAKARFIAMNGINPPGYVLTGPPPVCDDCIRLMGLGKVDLKTVRKYRMPLHPRCDHEWEELRGGKIPKGQAVWVG